SDFTPDASAARRIVQQAVDQQRTWLDPIEIAALLNAYAIPVASVALARDPDEAVAAAKPLLKNGAVAIKILSPDIVHKSDVGGVRLGLTDEAAVRAATAEMLERVQRVKPVARIVGVTVHPM